MIPKEGADTSKLNFGYILNGNLKSGNWFSSLFSGPNGRTYFIIAVSCGGIIVLILIIIILICIFKACKKGKKGENKV